MAKFNLTAQIQLQAPNNVSQVVKQIQSQLGGVNVPVQAKQAQKTTQQIQQLTQATTQATASTKKLGSTFQTSVRRFGAIAIATRAVSLFTNTLAASIREAIDFERELIRISQVTGKSVQQLKFLSNTVSELSTNLGVSSSALIGVSRVLSQAGLSANETTIALKTLAKTDLAPTFDDIGQTAEGAIAIFNQFQAGAAALEAQLGAVNAVAGQFAVEAGDLISVVRRTGGVFKAAGGDLNELIALFTSVRSTTRESAESIATGLRTIFTRIQRPKTIEFLKEYGVELLDLEGKFVGPYEAVRRLSEVMKGLEQGDISFIKIAEQLGGFRQIGKVIPLLQQFGVAEDALAVATGGANSLTEDQITAQQALAVQISKVREQFADLIRNVTQTSTFQAMAKTLLSLASAFIKIADSLAPVIPLLTTFAAIKVAGSLTGSIGAMMGSKMNQGGKVASRAKDVMHFARGGSVPGTGNRDTVPAMLTPGEFVIKKSSVAKLGAGTLTAMNENRYNKGMNASDVRKQLADSRSSSAPQQGKEISGKADGSTVTLMGKIDQLSKFVDKELEREKGLYGGAFLRPEGRDQVVKGTLAKSAITQQVKADPTIVSARKLAKDNPDVFGSIEKEVQQIIADSQGVESGFTLIGGSLEPAKANLMEDKLLTGIMGGVNEGAKLIGGSLGLKGTIDQAKILKTANIDQVVGNLFEASLLAASDVPPFKRQSANADFDFPVGLGGKLAGEFGLANLSGKPTDAKSTFTADALKSFTTKAQNFETKESVGDIQQILREKLQPLLPQLKAASTGDDFRKVVGMKKPSGRGFANTTEATDVLQDFTKKMAKGGPVGTDTVPALLTPGEFVVNKKAAQNIGYSKLGKMNKVGKFAKGGVVGTKVQKFEVGGGVGEGEAVSLNIAPLNAAMVNLTNITNGLSQGFSTMLMSVANLGKTANAVSAGNVKHLQTTGQLSAAEAQAAQGILASNNATLSALQGKNKEFQASLKAAMADEKEAHASLKAQQADEKEAVSSTSSGKSSMGFGIMMGSLASAMTMLAPTIDETSGYMDHLMNNISQTSMQLVAVLGVLGQITSIEKIGGMIDNIGPAFTKMRANLNGVGKKILGFGKANAAASGLSAKADQQEAAASNNAANADNNEAMSGGGGGGVPGGKGGKGGGMSGFAGGLMAAVAAVAAVAIIFNTLYGAAADYAKQLKEQAIEDGDVDAAGAAAAKEAGAGSRQTNSTIGAVVGGTIGAVGAGLATGGNPFAMAAGGAGGAAVGGAIGAGIGPDDAAIEAAVKRAKADAQATKATKALAKQTEDVNDAMQEFQAGNASVFDILQASSDAMAQTMEARRMAEEAQVAGLKESNAYLNSWTAWFRDIMNKITFGAVSSSADIVKPKLKEDEKRVDEAKKKEEKAFKNDKGIPILMKQVAAAGGGFEQFIAMLPEAQRDMIMSNKDIYRETAKSFSNVSKEAERTKKAFEAMNLGFHSVNAAATAASYGLNDYLAAQEAGNNSMSRTIATLEASVTSAAMGMDPAKISAALDEAASKLTEFGADPAMVDKFKGNMEGIAAAQQTFAQATGAAKDKMVADFNKGLAGKNSLTGKREAVAEAVVMNLPPSIGEDVKDRIRAAIEGGKLSESDMKEIMNGNFEPLSGALGDLGEKMLEQVMPAFKEMEAQMATMMKLRGNIIKLEQAYVDARKRSIDVEMEAASIKEEFGGKKVTNAQKESAILDKANLDSEGLGVGSLRDGSAASVSQRNSNIQSELTKIQDTRDAAARGDPAAEAKLSGESGMELASNEERLNKLAQQNYETTKKLIDLKRQELKVISARNKAEKDAMKSLMAGDIEKFLDQQAAVGAGAAIAVGNTGLAQNFGQSAIGGAFSNFEQMKADGAQDYFGKSIGGSGGLLEQTGTAFGFSKGSAQTLAGSTPEEEKLKAEARALADTLPQTAKIQEESARRGLKNAKIQYDAAQDQLKAARMRVNEAMKNAPKAKPKTEEDSASKSAPPLPKTQFQHLKDVNKEKGITREASPYSVRAAEFSDKLSGTTTQRDKLGKNTTYMSPEKIAAQNESSPPTEADSASQAGQASREPLTNKEVQDAQKKLQGGPDSVRSPDDPAPNDKEPVTDAGAKMSKVGSAGLSSANPSTNPAMDTGTGFRGDSASDLTLGIVPPKEMPLPEASSTQFDSPFGQNVSKQLAQKTQPSALESIPSKESSGADQSSQPMFDGSLITSLTQSVNKNSQALGTLGNSLSALGGGFVLQGADTFDGAVNNFGGHIDRFAGVVASLSSLSLQVQVGNSNVTVSITEPSFLKDLTGKLKEDILTQVQDKLDNMKPNESGKPKQGSPGSIT